MVNQITSEEIVQQTEGTTNPQAPKPNTLTRGLNFFPGFARAQNPSTQPAPTIEPSRASDTPKQTEQVEQTQQVGANILFETLLNRMDHVVERMEKLEKFAQNFHAEKILPTQSRAQENEPVLVGCQLQQPPIHEDRPLQFERKAAKTKLPESSVYTLETKSTQAPQAKPASTPKKPSITPQDKPHAIPPFRGQTISRVDTNGKILMGLQGKERHKAYDFVRLMTNHQKKIHSPFYLHIHQAIEKNPECKTLKIGNHLFTVSYKHGSKLHTGDSFLDKNFIMHLEPVKLR